MTPDPVEQLTDEDAASIGRALVEAAERVRIADKFAPGACTTVALYLGDHRFNVFVQVKHDG